VKGSDSRRGVGMLIGPGQLRRTCSGALMLLATTFAGLFDDWGCQAWRIQVDVHFEAALVLMPWGG
jgi:hypothetical protein